LKKRTVRKLKEDWKRRKLAKNPAIAMKVAIVTTIMIVASVMIIAAVIQTIPVQEKTERKGKNQPTRKRKLTSTKGNKAMHISTNIKKLMIISNMIKIRITMTEKENSKMKTRTEITHGTVMQRKNTYISDYCEILFIKCIAYRMTNNNKRKLHLQLKKLHNLISYYILKTIHCS